MSAHNPERFVRFTYGEASVTVTEYDALMLGSDLLLYGNAYVVPGGDHHRRIPPERIESAPPEVRRIARP